MGCCRNWLQTQAEGVGDVDNRGELDGPVAVLECLDTRARHARKVGEHLLSEPKLDTSSCQPRPYACNSRHRRCSAGLCPAWIRHRAPNASDFKHRRSMRAWTATSQPYAWEFTHSDAEPSVKTCEQAWCSPTQDQADQIGKDLADGAAPLSRVRERLMNGDLRLPLICNRLVGSMGRSARPARSAGCRSARHPTADHQGRRGGPGDRR